jgi:nitrogen fixation protein FixH
MTHSPAKTPSSVLPSRAPGNSPGTQLEDSQGRAWVWPAIVLGMLGMQIILCSVAYFVATSDPSQTVVHNYHTKALAWDEHQAQLRAGEALGWGVQFVVADRANLLGDRVVRLSLTDAQGDPLTGVSVSVKAFHFSRASDVVEADLVESASGEYVTEMKMRKAGRWELAFVTRLGEDVFPFTLQQQVGADGWKPR